MNNKMTINTYLSTTESKNKLSKQEEQRQKIQRAYGWLPDGRGCGRMGEEVRG